MIGTIVGVISIAGASWGAYEVIDGRVRAVAVAAQEYTDGAVRAGKAVHLADRWEDKVEELRRYLEFLRKDNAPPHRIQDAERDLRYAETEARRWAEELQMRR